MEGAIAVPSTFTTSPTPLNENHPLTLYRILMILNHLFEANMLVDAMATIGSETQAPQQDFSTRIEARHGWVSLNLQEIWQYRELIFYFIWRDVTVRYKQTILGIAWAILQPVTQMVIFTFIMGNLANLGSDGIPMPIFQYAAQVPWIFFSAGVLKATTSLVGSSAMIKKIYFPRLILPITSVTSGVVDFLLALSILVLMMFYFNVPFTLRLFYLPLMLGLAFVTALGVSLWLAPLNVMFRDIRYATPFMMSIWFWLTPAAYPSSELPAPFDTLYALNPMAGVVEGFRWAIAGAETEPGIIVLISAMISITLLVTGLFFFQRMEATYADAV